MADVGHNSKKDQERRLLFAHYHRIDRDLEFKRRALNEQKKANRQNAKAAGFPSSKLDHYLKSFLAEDQDKPVLRHQSDREDLMWLGLIPDSPQGDLLADRATKEQMIAAKGFHAGLTGLDRVSGYDAGSADDKLWLESFDAGRAEYETEIPDILARINAAASKEEPAAESEDPFADAAE